MNAWTSQEVFAGPYLQDAAEREKFSNAFIDMTVVSRKADRRLLNGQAHRFQSEVLLCQHLLSHSCCRS